MTPRRPNRRIAALAAIAALLAAGPLLPDPTPARFEQAAASSDWRERRESLDYQREGFSMLRNDRAAPFLADPDERVRDRALLVLLRSAAPRHLDLMDEALDDGRVGIEDLLRHLPECHRPHAAPWLREVRARLGDEAAGLDPQIERLEERGLRWSLDGLLTRMVDDHLAVAGIEP